MPTILSKETVRGNLTDFRNEPLTNFSVAENENAMKEALKTVRSQLGRQYPLIINGERIETSELLISTNPSCPSEVIGKFSKATTEHAEKAMQSALASFETWKKVPPQERAEYLFKAAKLMRERKNLLSSWLIVEIGKNWVEADADVAEAIDFCDYYAHLMLKLANPAPLVDVPGEKNIISYIPLGVGVVIPPWNFPLAILVGMTTASIVAGNTVILKPSSDTPCIAYQFAQIMEEVGLPKGVLNFLPGPGASVGDYLVMHPKTRFIAFTGSKEVGLRINELAAKKHPEQIWLKRVVAEMGGKDSIVVDSDADLDAAAEGIVASAFGFQGQKCSACSRAIVHKDVYDKVLEKVAERTRKLTIGRPEERTNYIGPVASKSAYQGILEYIEVGKKEGRVVTGGKAHDNADKGYFIEPTIIADVDPRARISMEEIFGPVLAFFKANSWKHALEIANNTEFGLTGAVYCRDRAKLDEAASDFHVGNLYLNRKCTGALVGANPFGGFNMSGTDSKAGGPDYLQLFSQGKVVTEKI